MNKPISINYKVCDVHDSDKREQFRDGRYSNFRPRYLPWKIPRYRVYRGTCFVIVVTKIKHIAHTTIKLKAETCLICLCSFIATSKWTVLIH